MAAEVAATIATGVAENLVDRLVVNPALSNLRYLFCFQNIVEEFKEQRKKLLLAQTRLENDIKEAIKQTQEIEQDVKDRREEADKVAKEAWQENSKEDD
ncbi:hypothetical protein DITRI_Ditri17bG0057100 [Diplodiscus trichospermus]